MPQTRSPSSGPHSSRRALLMGAAAALLAPDGAGAQTAAPSLPAPATPASPPPTADAPRLAAGPRATRLRPEPAGETEVWCFDGRAVPPTLRVRHGEAVRLRVENGTPRPLSLHWHGVRNRNAMDGVGGVTQPPIASGGAFTYEFTPPDAGTFLIRPLVVGGASEPSGRGLAGMLVVEERAPPPVDRDLTLVVQDWRLEEDGRPLPFGQTAFAAASGRLGNLVTVNGRPVPETVELRPRARVRLRIGNACNARGTYLRFDGLKVYVAAVDGQPTDTFEPLRATLPFPPGTRYDLILDLAETEGPAGALTALVGPGIPLATFATKGAAGAKRPPVAAIPENPLLPREIRLQNAKRVDLTIAGGARLNDQGQPSFEGDPFRAWSINGAAGSAGANPLFSVKRGTPVVLALTNKTAFTLPMHLHGHVFRLLHNLDDGWEPYWLDTFQLVEGRTARLAFVADNPGRWVISSSVLDRFDAGLWTSFEVT